ncbi:MAG: 3-phosphoshikimate 1-carboxyvinyltransferase [Myxococcaceae bacterium]
MTSSLVPPLSKSDAQRALVLAEVTGVPFASVWPEGEAMPRDVAVLRDGLVALRASTATIDCHDGGAPFRFLLGQAAVSPGRRVTFTGTARLGERPHAPLLAALQAAIPGLKLEAGSPWPLVVTTPERIDLQRMVVSGVQSSQFASSVLLAAAKVATRTGHPVDVVIDGALASEGYFALTRRWVEAFGGLDGTSVRPLSPPARVPPIPGDWSSLGYLLALSWVARLPVERIVEHSGHPDESLLTHFASVGLSLDANCIVSGAPRAGFTVDAASCPDSVPLLAALATRLPAPSRFSRAAILKVKESDRLAGTVELLRAAGHDARVDDDVLHVTPGTPRAFSFDARDDHRMAMSAAVLARLHGVKLTLTGRDSVQKSFPGFWTEAAKADVDVAFA